MRPTTERTINMDFLDISTAFWYAAYTALSIIIPVVIVLFVARLLGKSVKKTASAFKK